MIDDEGDADESRRSADDTPQRPTTRRRALALLALGGAGTLSGCAGFFDAGESETPISTATPVATGNTTETRSTDPRPTPDPPPADPTHVGVMPVDPSRVQFNPYNPRYGPEISHHLLFEPFAKYYYSTNEFRPAALSGWEHTGDAFVLTLRDDLSWTNGETVTAEDVVSQLRIGKFVDDPVWQWADGVAASDSRTVQISVTGNRNPALLERDLFADRFVQVDRRTYGDFLSDLEGGAPVTELTNFEDREPVTCGPFELDSRDVDGLSFFHFEPNPYSVNFNFRHYRLEFATDENRRQAALMSLSRDSDYNLSVPAHTVAEFPDGVESVRTPTLDGLALVPNHAHRHLGNRVVRRAIAYTIDRAKLVEQVRPLSMTVPGIPAGLASSCLESWLGDEGVHYDDYGVSDRRVEAACAALEGIGFERVDGSWRDATSRTVSIPVTVPSGRTEWIKIAERVVGHLDEFGFDASVEQTDAHGEILTNGDFVVALTTWLHGGPTAYPYYSLRHQLWEPCEGMLRYNYPGANDSDGTGGSATEVTVPSRGEQGEVTVDVGRRLQELARATDEATASEIVRELAWVTNQDLPLLPLVETLNQQWLTSDQWTVPGNLDAWEEANVEWAPTWLLRQGLVNYSSG